MLCFVPGWCIGQIGAARPKSSGPIWTAVTVRWSWTQTSVRRQSLPSDKLLSISFTDDFVIACFCWLVMFLCERRKQLKRLVLHNTYLSICTHTYVFITCSLLYTWVLTHFLIYLRTHYTQSLTHVLIKLQRNRFNSCRIFAYVWVRRSFRSKLMHFSTL